MLSIDVSCEDTGNISDIIINLTDDADLDKVLQSLKMKYEIDFEILDAIYFIAKKGNNDVSISFDKSERSIIYYFLD